MNWLNSFALGNAVLIPFALLVGVPLLLHLFARAKPPAYRFPSIEFIQKIIRQTIRLKRPQSWLVLVLRTLLVAALVAVFLQPVYFGKTRLAGRSQKKHVVVLVDASASMSCMEGSQTRFASACAKASEVLASLSTSDLVNLIWLRTPSRPEYPSLGVNREHLQGELRKAEAGSEAADIHGGMAMALEMLKDPEASREICVISDFQKTAWGDFHPAIPEGIRLLCIPCAGADAPNQAITRVTSRPAHPLLGEDVTIYAEVENFSSEPVLRMVYLRAGESRQTQEVRLAPWTRSVAAFPCRFSGPGRQVVAVTLGEDAFPSDNERHLEVDVEEHLRVALFAGEPVTAEFWKRALDAAGWSKVEMISREGLSAKIEADVLLLSGWDGKDPARVAEFVKEGGLVVWYPGAGASERDIMAVAGVATKDAPPLVWQKAEKPHRLKVANADDPVFGVFNKGARGDPTRGLIRARYEMDAARLTGAKPVLQYEDGVPALAFAGAGGRLVIWNIPLQTEFSNWAGQPEFLPFLNELVLQHRGGDASRQGGATLLPGQSLRWSFGQDVVAKDVQLEREGRVIEARRESDAKGVVFASAPVPATGDYQWKLRGRVVAHSIVNFPVIESDLRTIAAADLEKPGAVAVAAGHSVAGMREGTRLWPLLLGIALALALVEGLVLMKAEKT